MKEVVGKAKIILVKINKAVIGLYLRLISNSLLVAATNSINFGWLAQEVQGARKY